ncbi:MAG: CRISPR-associated endonuclease Cas1 [Chloroflexi bacterium]|nr:MAG: CRISPR-associated endonuclease Cas1 [Chloroflexota bacterium]
MELIVEGKGSFLGKHQGRLRVMQERKTITEVPLIHLKQVIIVDGGVSISSDVIRTCSEEGIPIYFLSGREGKMGIAAAKAFVTGKLANQGNLLRYMAKYRKETNPALYEELMLVAVEMRDYLHELEQLNAEKIDDIREQMLSVEGRAAQRYWAMVGRIIPGELAWPGRETQGATDLFNAALNYGYGVLYGRIEHALTLAGLDPFGGFLHTDRPGKPSLVLDCIEEFRQTIVDRTIIGLVNKHVPLQQDEQGLLTEATRRKIAEKITERLESSETYEKKRQALRFILQSQARHLALFLRNDRPHYEPFVAGW